MTATLAVLDKLKSTNKNIQADLNSRTVGFSNELNQFFLSENIPIKINHYSSIFQFSFQGNNSYVHQPLVMDLFYHMLIFQGIYTWEARTCFFSLAHGEYEVNKIMKLVKQVSLQLKELGFFNIQTL